MARGQVSKAEKEARAAEALRLAVLLERAAQGLSGAEEALRAYVLTLGEAEVRSLRKNNEYPASRWWCFLYTTVCPLPQPRCRA